MASFIPALTGLRALAVTAVLVLHLQQAIPLDGLPSFARGYLGVDLFFILSGFVIAHVYARDLAHPTLRNVGAFFRKRFARLYPLHALMTLAFVALVLASWSAGVALRTPDAWRLGDLWAQALMLQGWGFTPPGWNAPAWSVGVECFAYLLFPAIAVICVRLRNAPVAGALAGLMLVGMFAVQASFGWSGQEINGPAALTRGVGSFLCGAFLHRYAVLSSSRSHDALGMLALLALPIEFVFGLPYQPIIVTLALLVFAAGTSTGYYAKALGRGVLVWLGDRAYSLYMVHFAVLLIAHRVELPPVWRPLGWAAVTTVVVGLAALLYRYVEMPARRALNGKNPRETSPYRPELVRLH